MDITVDELKTRLQNQEKVNIIDVREEWEYEEGNIGGQLIPLATLPMAIENQSLEAWKDQEVVVHCKSGKRSETAQKVLQMAGFTQVRNLIGGIEAYWKA
ncbi:MAG TPA: NADH oxidase [Microscillaceae bacterium]|jgi:rhodanese-related sulfurtransferase|nr:NADH oxidase [Microscillaceae bacterium]